MSTLTSSMTEQELDRLESLLERVNREAMTLTVLDGFFCALVCGPCTEPVDTFFAEILGQDPDGNQPGYSLVDPQELSSLLLRHWNQIAAAMMAGGRYVPIFSLDANGNPDGRDWAQGFALGMQQHAAAWGQLGKSKEHWELLAPVTILLAASDPKLAQEITRTLDTREERIELLANTTTCLNAIFDHFHPGVRKSHSRRK